MRCQKIEFHHHPVSGWGTLKSTARQLLSQGITARGAKTMLSADRPDDFNCPGYAWPDRDHISIFKFCENGVKAVAAGATSRCTMLEFFAQRIVRELAE